jgi:hypothetical protein
MGPSLVMGVAVVAIVILVLLLSRRSSRHTTLSAAHRNGSFPQQPAAAGSAGDTNGFLGGAASPSHPSAHASSPCARQVLDKGSIELNSDFREAADMVAQGQSVYITGKAGTGKSTLLQYLRATTTKAVAVVAPTGIAAINVGGQTIHSFFHFPPQVIRPQELRPCRDASLMRRLDMLIVDEVSMVRADLMDGIDAALRLNRGRPQTPFGGVQIVLIGDLFQLPPVVREQEVKDYLLTGTRDHTFSGHQRFAQPRSVSLTCRKCIGRQTQFSWIFSTRLGKGALTATPWNCSTAASRNSAAWRSGANTLR